MKNNKQGRKMVYGGYLLMLLILAGFNASAQQFIRYLDRPPLNEKQKHHADVLIHDKTTAGYWYVAAEASLIQKRLGFMSITLPDNTTLLIDRMSYSDGFASMVSGSGKFEPGGDFIVTEHNGMITARIGSNQYSYMLYPLSGDLHMLLLLNTSAFPKDESQEGYENMIENGKRDTPSEEVQTRIDPETGLPISPSQLLAGACKVRALVAYTDDVAAAIADPIGFAQSCIQANNTAFSNSSVNFQVELACAFETSYAESGNSATDKTRFRNNGDGFMDDVFDWRTYYDADLCHLLVNSLSNGCGEAWAVSVSVYADAFCVTDRGCAVGNLTFPHEFGHLYGCRHDPYVDNTATPYAYAHGKVVFNSYRTVMAYVDHCDANGATCPRVAYFSNPAITYLGTSTGTANLRDNESGHEASRVAISGLETSLTNKTFPSWTHDDGEYGDVLGITSVSNTTTYVMNSGSEVVWRAGTYHVMQPGFWAKAGSKFLTMFDNCTPLTIAEPSNEKASEPVTSNGFVKVQPNPFQDQFNAVVEMAESGFLKLELLDGTGKLIQLVSEQRSASEGPHTFTIDMSDKAEGIYFLLVRRGEEVKTMKLIKVE